MDDKTQPSKIYQATDDREKDANDYISNDVKLIIISIEEQSYVTNIFNVVKIILCSYHR